METVQKKLTRKITRNCNGKLNCLYQVYMYPYIATNIENMNTHNSIVFETKLPELSSVYVLLYSYGSNGISN